MSTDTEISCVACGTQFPFTAEEQEFYDSKGFNPPKKCKPCRDAAKAARGGGGGRYNDRGGYGQRPQRQLYDAICASCNVTTQVPFRPSGEKPVYCRECFQAQRAY